MAVKAKLKIQLLANEVLIAESDDEKLWRKILAAMQVDQGSAGEAFRGGDEAGLPGEKGEGGALEAFAKELGVSEAVLKGACDPSMEEPYIHLDPKCWESFTKHIPPRGRGSVAPVQLAATLLCLWFRHAKLEGKPTQVGATAVLGTIGVRGNNPSRSIKNCEWLQARGGGIQINAAKQSKAISVAKAYCEEKPLAGAE